MEGDQSPPLDTFTDAIPERKSDALAVTFTLEVYQPFNPSVPLMDILAMGAMGSYAQLLDPEADMPEMDEVAV